MKKYGIENFNIEEVKKIECQTKDILNSCLNKIEIMFIEKYDTYENGYNLTIGGKQSIKKITKTC